MKIPVAILSVSGAVVLIAQSALSADIAFRLNRVEPRSIATTLAEEFDLASARPVVDISELYDALRDADAAGDTATARHLANFIRANPHGLLKDETPGHPVPDWDLPDK
jgi:hypothetical protein